VRLTEIAESERSGELSDSDVNLGVDSCIVRESEENDVESYIVEKREHRGRAVREEVGENGFRVGEMGERDLE